MTKKMSAQAKKALIIKSNRQIEERIGSFLGELLYEEMARVRKENNYDIRIYTENLGNPSFHVLYKDEWEVVLQIKDWNVLEVKNSPFEKGKQLPNKIKKTIKNILLMWDEEFNMISWKVLLIEWNRNNEKYQIDKNMKIPD